MPGYWTQKITVTTSMPRFISMGSVFWGAMLSLWGDITDGEGYAHQCEPKAHYRVRGERVVSFSDHRGRQGMAFILSYLGTQSQRTVQRVY